MTRTIRTEWTVRSRPCGYTVESRVTGQILPRCHVYRPEAKAEAARLNAK